MHNLYSLLNRNVILYVTVYLSEETVVSRQTNSEFWLILNVDMLSAFRMTYKFSKSKHLWCLVA